jgi:prepilin-type processing-associated H-X9-DG protein
VKILDEWYGSPFPGGQAPYAQTDYAGNSADRGNNWLGDENAPWHNEGDGPVFFQDNGSYKMKATMASVADGTSNVIMVGEKALDAASCATSACGDDNEGYTAGWDGDTMRHTGFEPQNDARRRGTGTGDSRFGSAHPGALNILLVDGSVQSITYTIDLRTWRRMGHRDDGQVVQFQ